MASQKDLKWRIVSGNPIILDFNGCKYASEVHARIKDAFGFPNAYGANWDALWDFLDDFAASQVDTRQVLVCGLSSLPNDLRQYANQAVEIMKELEQEYPIMKFTLSDNN